jgi:uracil-DNA glycosylase
MTFLCGGRAQWPVAPSIASHRPAQRFVVKPFQLAKQGGAVEVELLGQRIALVGQAIRQGPFYGRGEYHAPTVRWTYDNTCGAPPRIVAMALDLVALLPADWRAAMTPYLDPQRVAALGAFVEEEYRSGPVYPPLADLFRAFRLCTVDAARLLILGQDPYHKAGQAHGLSFSVAHGVAVPPSLRNVFKELRDDLGVRPPVDGDLSGWAAQGVLLLNAVLTVRGGMPASHANRGWEHVTDAAIKALNAKDSRVVFVLWGGYARKKAGLVTGPEHVVVEAGHPSPMNPRGFLGSRPFSAVDKALAERGLPPIRWA